MKNETLKYNSGLTFVEAIFVIGLTTIIGLVVLSFFSSSKTKARDTRRFTDLENIQIAMELFFLDKGYYPRSIKDGATGRIGEGNKIDLLLMPYMSKQPPSDPLGPGDDKFYYYYDGNHNCEDNKATTVAVIFASNLEKVPGNSSNFCSNWSGENNEGGLNSWNIVLGRSSDGS